jgi:hypothetical protein
MDRIDREAEEDERTQEERMSGQDAKGKGSHLESQGERRGERQRDEEEMDHLNKSYCSPVRSQTFSMLPSETTHEGNRIIRTLLS